MRNLNVRYKCPHLWQAVDQRVLHTPRRPLLLGDILAALLCRPAVAAAAAAAGSGFWAMVMVAVVAVVAVVAGRWRGRCERGGGAAASLEGVLELLLQQRACCVGRRLRAAVACGAPMGEGPA
jgi:hypothetical protein